MPDRINGSINPSIGINQGLYSRVIHTDGSGEYTGFEIEGFLQIADTDNDSNAPFAFSFDFNADNQGLRPETIDEQPEDVLKLFLGKALKSAESDLDESRRNGRQEAMRAPRRATIFGAIGGVFSSGGLLGVVESSDLDPKFLSGLVALVGIGMLKFTYTASQEAASNRADKSMDRVARLSRLKTLLQLANQDNAVFVEAHETENQEVQA